MTKNKSQVGGTKTTILTILSTALFVFVCAIIVFPVLAGFLASFRPGKELMYNGLSINFDFATMSLSNYQYILSGNGDSLKYLNSFKNSLFLTFVTVVATLIICYFIAYGISMYDFKLRNLLFFLVIATMMVPFEILMLPLYREIINLKLVDTTWGVVLPGVCGASTIFFFRQYMMGVPKELLEAGRIDGANEYTICARVILPIVKPAFASMAILTSMGSWNNLLWPMLVYRSSSKFTLPVYLNGLLTPYGNNYDVLIAGSMFSIIPVMIVFLAFQSYFIDGMVAGAVKG